MATDPITNATNRLAEIKREIGALQAEVREIENALAVMRRFGATENLSLPAADPSVGGQPAASLVTMSGSPPQVFQMSQAEFEVLATRALTEAERPLTRTQFLKWLENNGISMTGTDASKNVGTKFWRSKDRFVNLRGVGYWLKDQPCPAFGYDPANIAEVSDMLDELLGGKEQAA